MRQAVRKMLPNRSPTIMRSKLIPRTVGLENHIDKGVGEPERPTAGDAGSRFAALTRLQAALVLVAVLGFAAWLLAEGRPHAPASAAFEELRARQGGDVELYKAVVARVRAGEGYYDAAGAELRARAYPLRPAF